MKSHDSGRAARTSEAEGPLHRLLREGGLYPVFQPLVDLRDGSVFAHEALIRGPVDTPLHMPVKLLKAAATESLQAEFELRCVDIILARWGRMREPGRLFLNMSADVLSGAMKGSQPTWLERTLSACGVSPRVLTVEITEHEATRDIEALRHAVKMLHGTGALLALDDFGTGHSSLRLWTELKPDFVKIDGFFTAGIAASPDKLEIVRAVRAIGDAFGTRLVGEGIDNGDDLRILRDLDIGFGQGYFLGRPHAELAAEIPAAALAVVKGSRVAVMPHAQQQTRPGVLRSLTVIQAPGLSPRTTNDEVAQEFQRHTELHALAVVDEGQPVALINRQQFMNDYARLYFREVHGRKPCVPYANRAPRVVELDDDVTDLLGILTSDDQRYLSDGFIVTENGRYLGLGTGDQLVRAVTETRIEAARHANPLTFLPGNIPISLHIDRLLASGAEFVACYADLNDFKPFNDRYGFWLGDEMIRMVAKLALMHCDARNDFVGHIGGDDFIILFQSPDWRERCERIVEEFARKAPALFDEPARAAGGFEAEDRHGVSRFFRCTTLAIGAVRIGGGKYNSAEEVAIEAAMAKHDAKQALSGIAVRDAGQGALPPPPPATVQPALSEDTD